MEDDQEQQPPESLLPYAEWIETALRQVVVRAVEHVGKEGLPGGHHFYITFRTDHPGVVIPPHLRAQYPHEMTIVLQNRFWDLKFSTETQAIGVGLSFGGVGSTLVVPLDSLIAFADPYVGHVLRFHPVMPEDKSAEAAPVAKPEAADEKPTEAPQVVSLDAFRRRTPPKN
ncbi:MAG: ClpXP protease specificity-enhancing factor SspB [Rhodospirillales bacterium]